MRLATFFLEGRIGWGAVRDDSIVSLERVAPTLLDLIQADGPTVERARQAAAEGRDTIALDRVKLLAPIPRPLKNIFALGRNYSAHARESAVARNEAPGAPVYFTKAVTTVNAPFGDLVVDPRVSEQVDWEVELGVVIGRVARHVSMAAALDHVFGYTVLNDVSARDLQFQTTQYFVGKSVDGYCPMGPWITTADEVPDPQSLVLRCRVNGVLKQEGQTRDMLYPVAHIIHDLSRILTLDPGDVIATGTPEGVGFARKPPEFLRPGDVVESEIEGLGTLRNRVVHA